MKPIKMKVAPSAGMLWPRPRPVALRGRDYLILEFRVRDIGEVEYQAALIAGHPRRGAIGEIADLIERRVEEFRKLPREEQMRMGRLYMQQSKSWPPTMGASAFQKAMGTTEGCVAFLRVLLARTHPELDDDDVVELAFEMDDAEWAAVERIAWGKAPWEASGSGDGPARGRGGDRGTDWAAIAHAMAVESGWSYDQIGDLYVNQLLNELQRGGARNLWITPLGADD